jgi:hypothetical protein
LIGATTYSLDGSTLFGTMQWVDLKESLITIDVATGVIEILGDLDTSNWVEGLAFRPEDGVLFAIDRQPIDILITIEDDGNNLITTTIGPFTGIAAYGLAFVSPAAVPVLTTPAILLLSGLVGLTGLLWVRRRAESG